MVFETENRSQNRSTQKMLPRNDPDRIQIAFDDHRLVANAGLLLPVTLALHLACPNWLTVICTWAMHWVVPTPATR